MCPPTTQQPQFALAHCAVPCAILSQPAAPVVPGGQIHSRSFPVLVAKEGGFVDYPPAYPADADEALVHTYGSYLEEPPIAVTLNTRRDDSWTLCVPVDAPAIPNPTLLSIDYAIKYATTADEGNATVQTDVVLTTTALPADVVSAREPLGVYRPGAGVRMINQAAALCLSRTLSVKCNGGGEQWNYHLETHHVVPNVRVRDPAARAYVVFTVNEHSSLRTARSLSVEVSAVWQKEEVEMKAKTKAEKEAKEKEAKVAQELAERKAREAEEKAARDEVRAWMVEERQARKAEAEARAEAKQAREEERKWREEFRIQWEADRAARVAAAAPMPKPSVEAAPDVADENVQHHIKETMARLNIPPCPQGYGFVKVTNGYRCKGGSHFVTFEQLGMTTEAKPKPSIEAAPDHADESVQHHIQETMAKLNMAPCPQGYAFVKVSNGYRCKGGSHFVSFEQLGMK